MFIIVLFISIYPRSIIIVGRNLLIVTYLLVSTTNVVDYTDSVKCSSCRSSHLFVQRNANEWCVSVNTTDKRHNWSNLDVYRWRICLEKAENCRFVWLQQIIMKCLQLFQIFTFLAEKCQKMSCTLAMVMPWNAFGLTLPICMLDHKLARHIIF